MMMTIQINDGPTELEIDIDDRDSDQWHATCLNQKPDIPGWESGEVDLRCMKSGQVARARITWNNVNLVVTGLSRFRDAHLTSVP